MARFLVVDDERSSVAALTRLLRGDGHDVAPFTSGADAVDALSVGTFDVVVTDLDMPRVDGGAVVRVARERFPHACVVVISARAEANRDRLLEAGACAVREKPVDYDRFATDIAECRKPRAAGVDGSCHARRDGCGSRGGESTGR